MRRVSAAARRRRSSGQQRGNRELTLLDDSRSIRGPPVVGNVSHPQTRVPVDGGSQQPRRSNSQPTDPQHGSSVGTLVDLGLHNTNRHDIIHGPAITVPPPQARVADPRPSCRTAVLDAIDRLYQRTGSTQFTRRDIVTEVRAAKPGPRAADHLPLHPPYQRPRSRERLSRS
jgi:hypothetical protein